MATGMYASMLMARNWEDAFMHATTMMRVKINAWTSSKLANSTALARYRLYRTVYTFFIILFFRKIALVAALVMTTLVQRQQQLQMLQLLPHHLRPHLLLLMQF